MIELNNISISTNKKKLDIPLIHKFLTNSYWAKGRSVEAVKTSIEHSVSFGLYYGDSQIGFARVATDYSIFAYIMDVFVLDEYRGQGLGKLLMQYIVHDSKLHHVENWMLATNDAHDLYKKVGFVPLENPKKWMVFRPKF